MGNQGLRVGDGGGMDGVDTEKDKMLVEKQKVIEELTWKLHQEQRQVGQQQFQINLQYRTSSHQTFNTKVLLLPLLG